MMLSIEPAAILPAQTYRPESRSSGDDSMQERRFQDCLDDASAANAQSRRSADSMRADAKRAEAKHDDAKHDDDRDDETRAKAHSKTRRASTGIAAVSPATVAAVSTSDDPDQPAALVD